MLRSLRLGFGLCALLFASANVTTGCDGGGGGGGGSSDECTSNADCKDKGADYVCVDEDGTKVCKKTACPATCSTDTDCSSCADDKTSCVQGVCGQQTAQCPSSCTDNSDCASCPGADNVCDTATSTCKQGNTNVCPPTCSGDSECAPCGTGFTCEQGACAKTSSNPNVGAPCSAAEPCAQGFVCQPVPEGGSVCFQDCSQDSSICAGNTDGRTSCVELGSGQGGISVCLAVAKKGEKCGYQGALQAVCETGQDPPLYCSTSGLCTEVVVQKNAGDPCNPEGDTTEPIKLCDSASGLVCDATTGKCVTATVAQEGEPCDPTGANLGKTILCDPSKKDLACIKFDQWGRVTCQTLCDPQGTSQCGHNTALSCAAVLSNGGGACMDTQCTTDADCVWPGYTCEAQQGSGNICWPNPPPGPKAFGEICGTPVSTEGCASGLDCLGVPPATQGFCSMECTSGTTCPSIGNKVSECTPITAVYEACMFTCGAPADCPAGLVCDTNINYCLAP